MFLLFCYCGVNLSAYKRKQFEQTFTLHVFTHKITQTHSQHTLIYINYWCVINGVVEDASYTTILLLLLFSLWLAIHFDFCEIFIRRRPIHSYAHTHIIHCTMYLLVVLANTFSIQYTIEPKSGKQKKIHIRSSSTGNSAATVQ